jgi:mono/diheme cytochrome c family protein
MNKRLVILGIVGVSLFTASCSVNPPTQKEELAQDITDFDALYGKNCAGCHGPQGKNGPAQALNDPLYLSLIPKDELRKVIENGRPGTSMPGFSMPSGGDLRPKQIDALVNGIQQKWSRQVDLGGAKLPPYAGETSAGSETHGQQVFQTACASCHGSGAKAGAVTDGPYLELVTDQYLRTSVVAGRPDLGMPDWRTVSGRSALSEQDVSDVVAYLGSLRPGQARAANQNAPTGERKTSEESGK